MNTTSELPLIGITNYQNYQLSGLSPIKMLILNQTLVIPINHILFYISFKLSYYNEYKSYLSMTKMLSDV